MWQQCGVLREISDISARFFTQHTQPNPKRIFVSNATPMQRPPKYACTRNVQTIQAVFRFVLRRSGLDQFASQRICAAFDDLYANQVPDLGIFRSQMNRVKIFGLSDHLPLKTSILFKQNTHFASHHAILNLALLLGDQSLQTVQALGRSRVINHRTFCCGCSGTWGVFEAERLPVFNFLDQVHRVLKILFGFLGEADDEIA
jgi:hypothetical protein